MKGEVLSQKNQTSIFVDRETFIKTFTECYLSIRTNRSQSVVFLIYGPPGIGKTAIIRKLVEKAQHTNIPYSYITLSSTSYIKPFDVLRNIKASLENFGFKFESSNILFENNNCLKEIWSMPITNKLGINFEKHPKSRSIISTILKMLIPEKVRILIEGFINLSEVYKKNRIIQQYSLSDHVLQNEDELLDKLSKILALEISKKMNSPPIIFIDAYEQLFQNINMFDPIEALRRDEWLVTLFVESKGVLFVVASREKPPHWSFNRALKSIYKEFRVSNLSEKDAIKLLNLSGIRDKNIQNAILESSTAEKIDNKRLCYPFTLSLAIEFYQEMIEKNEEIDLPDFLSDFSTSSLNKIEMLERILRHLESEERILVAILSLTHFWDKDLWEKIREKYVKSYSPINFGNFHSYSFIKKLPEGKYCIHESIRVIINKNFDTLNSALKLGLNKREIKKFLSDYYKTLVEKDEI